jgi:superoxide dismutase
MKRQMVIARPTTPLQHAHHKQMKFSLLQKRFKFTLPDLPYDFNALEPVISAEIMQIHHQKHHAAYVANLNSALERFEAASEKADLSTQVALQSQIKFNGGGNLNHSIFWRNLCPVRDAQGSPHGHLKEEIEREFGSFDRFKAYFSSQTAQVQGSGWGWLVRRIHSREYRVYVVHLLFTLHRDSILLPKESNSPALPIKILLKPPPA